VTLSRYHRSVPASLAFDAACASKQERVFDAPEFSRPKRFAEPRCNENPQIDLETLITAAQNHDEAAIESLIAQFQPLLRSRAHRLWAIVRAGLSSLEWADVEAQITLIFLLRVQGFRPQAGVYFPHYIEKMLDFDGRAWVRGQNRGVALPFSQLSTVGLDEGEENDDFDAWLGVGDSHFPDESRDIERALSLRAALDELPAPQREVVWNCCVLGRTEADVAAQLGLSRSAVRNRLESALVKMRAFLDVSDDSPRECLSRTGRRVAVTTQPLAPAREAFWSLIFAMAKDEKRPDLVGVGAGRPVLLQGVFDFEATGLKSPELLSPELTYTVPIGSVAGIRYLRVGSVCDQMVVVSTVVNGMTHRLVPCAAHSTAYVPFAIVDPIVAGSQIEIHLASAAPGTAIIDVGCLQMPA